MVNRCKLNFTTLSVLVLVLVILLSPLSLAESPPVIEEITLQRVENDCLYYFYGINCKDCQDVNKYIEQLELRYPQLDVKRYEVYQDRENFNLLQDYFSAYGIPEESQGIPVVFMPNSYFIGKVITTLLAERIVDNKDTSCPALEKNEVVGVVGESSSGDILEVVTFSSVTGAALGNSFKPPVVAVLLLFLMLLLLIPARSIVKSSLFILGVYLAFFLFSLGLFSEFTNQGIGYFFYKTIAFLGIVCGVMQMKNFFGKRKELLPGKWDKIIVKPVSIFLLGALFCGIHYAGEVYLHEPIPERKQRMEEDLEIINDFYKTIPFDDLVDDERYAPLFVVNRLLPGVKRKMNLFFEDPTEDTYEHFFLACNAVHTVGYLYRESFDDALKKVRAYPEGDGFRIQLIGITGTEWNY